MHATHSTLNATVREVLKQSDEGIDGDVWVAASCEDLLLKYFDGLETVRAAAFRVSHLGRSLDIKLNQCWSSELYALVFKPTDAEKSPKVWLSHHDEITTILESAFSPDFLEELKRCSPYEVGLRFALLSTYVERLLFDVYFSLERKSSDLSTQPRVLRDLLECDAISRFLGGNLSLAFLAVMGPMSGLNMRNLLWHGFLDFRELDPVHLRVLCLLTIQAISLVAEARHAEKTESSFDFSPSPLVDLRTDADALEKSGVGSFPTMPKIVDRSISDVTSNLKQCEEIMSASTFIFPGRHGQVLSAFEEHSKGRRDRCLALLIPCLEHSLRRHYVSLNSLPIEMLSAQTEVYYTTLDSILSPTLPNEMYSSPADFRGNREVSESDDSYREYLNSLLPPPTEESKSNPTDAEGGARNRLVDALCSNLFDALCDLFMFRPGPRLRDRVAHANVSNDAIDERLSKFAITLTLALCDKFPRAEQSTSAAPRLKANANACILQGAVSAFSTYRTRLHPIAALFCAIEELNVVFEDFERFCPNEGNQSTFRIASGKMLSLQTELIEPLSTIASNTSTQSCSSSNLFGRFPELYSRKEEFVSEINVLTRIFEEKRKCLEAFTNGFSELQAMVASGKASSRKRKTFDKLRGAAKVWKFIAAAQNAVLVKAMSTCNFEIAPLQRTLTACERELKFLGGNGARSKASAFDWQACLKEFHDFLPTLTKLSSSVAKQPSA